MDGGSLLLQNRIDQKSKEIFLPEAGNLGCHQTPEELQHRVQSNSLKKKPGSQKVPEKFQKGSGTS